MESWIHPSSSSPRPPRATSLAKIFSSLASSPLGALISKTPSAAAERRKRGGGSDIVSLAQSTDEEDDDGDNQEEVAQPGLILDLTTHNHQHLGGAAGAVAAGGGAAAAAAAAVAAAAAAAGVPPAGAVSVNAPPAASAGGVAGGGIVGVPHHLGGLLGAAGVGAMPVGGGVGVGGGGGDMDLILDGPGAPGLCSATTASIIGGSCIRSPSPTRLAYTSEKHPRSTFHELNMIRKHQDLCDVMINVGSRKILAHKYVPTKEYFL